MNCQIVTAGLKPSGKPGMGAGFEFDIENPFALITIKVAMVLHVWAKAGGTPLQAHLPGQTARNQGG